MASFTSSYAKCRSVQIYNRKCHVHFIVFFFEVYSYVPSSPLTWDHRRECQVGHSGRDPQRSMSKGGPDQTEKDEVKNGGSRVSSVTYDLLTTPTRRRPTTISRLEGLLRQPPPFCKSNIQLDATKKEDHDLLLSLPVKACEGVVSVLSGTGPSPPSSLTT